MSPARAAGEAATHELMNVHDKKVHGVSSREDVLRERTKPDEIGPPTVDRRAARAGLGERLGKLALKTIMPFAVIGAGLAGYTYLKATKPDAPKRAKVERSFAINTVVAKRITLQPSLKLYGTTVAGRQVDIRSLVSGRVVEASDALREGGQLSKGEIIVQIDPFDFRNSVAEVSAQLKESRAKLDEFQASIKMEETSLTYAREQLELARIDLNRAKPLVERGTVSKRTVDDRQQIVLQRQQAADQIANNLNVWRTRVVQQEATVSRLQTVLSRAKQRLDETRLKAPFNAFVNDVTSQVGRMVSANDKVATLIDRDWIEARFSLTDEQFGRIVAAEGSLVGRNVEVEWILGESTFTYSATIDRVGARIAAETGGVEVFARVTDPSRPVQLRPGAFVEIMLPDKRFSDVIRLPNAALYEGAKVYVVVEGRLQSRPVDVVGSDGADILVTGELKDGARVLATRISTPGDGVKVNEVPAP